MRRQSPLWRKRWLSWRAEILQAASDYSRLNRLMQEKEEKEAQLEEKMERWMYLNELAEQIGAQ